MKYNFDSLEGWYVKLRYFKRYITFQLVGRLENRPTAHSFSDFSAFFKILHHCPSFPAETHPTKYAFPRPEISLVPRSSTSGSARFGRKSFVSE